MTTSAQAKAAALEGLDFIETEEDVKAVEAATLKIQSTFRGKKIRSKFGGGAPEKPQAEPVAKAEVAQKQAVNKSAGQQQQQSKQPNSCKSSSKHKQQPQQSRDETGELSRRVGAMQVQDNNGAQQPQAAGGPPEEQEAERAATKIQAGFKGYKARKELEGGAKQAGGGGADEAAPGGK